MSVPQWLLKKMPEFVVFSRTNRIISSVNTVCRSAACPNILECFSNRHTAFMILGSSCTRNCAFCGVDHGTPLPVDSGEPARVAEAAKELGLSHVVVTSVSRDDLADGGALQFARTIEALHRAGGMTVEVLIPDFGGNNDSLRQVMDAEPHVIAHNLETVRRLQPVIRPRAGYERSLDIIRHVKVSDKRILAKSGLILGLGENDSEILAAMTDLREAGCDILTLGQYRQPGENQLPVPRFILEEGFEYWREEGMRLGFSHVFSGSYVRSSYRAGDVFQSDGGKPTWKTGGY
ncbi:MAG: lipoyl synthase [Clostridiales bacterium]|jgi:lipoic acid synthetase|nr:lipoyl synthase [Clostridiales bacterium]